MKKRRKHSEQKMRSLYDRYTTESIRLKELLTEAKIPRSVFSRWRRKFDALANPSVEAKLSKTDFLRLKQHTEHEEIDGSELVDRVTHVRRYLCCGDCG